MPCHQFPLEMGCALSPIPTATLVKLVLPARWLPGQGGCWTRWHSCGCRGCVSVPWSAVADFASPNQEHCTGRVHWAMPSDAASSQLLLLLTSLCNGTCHRPHKLWVLEPFTRSLFPGQPRSLSPRCLTSSRSSTPTAHPKSPAAFSRGPSVPPTPCPVSADWVEQR